MKKGIKVGLLALGPLGKRIWCSNYPNPLLEQRQRGHFGKFLVGGRIRGGQEDGTVVRDLLGRSQDAVVGPATAIVRGLQCVDRVHQGLGVAEARRFRYACGSEDKKDFNFRFAFTITQSSFPLHSFPFHAVSFKSSQENENLIQNGKSSPRMAPKCYEKQILRSRKFKIIFQVCRSAFMHNKFLHRKPVLDGREAVASSIKFDSQPILKPLPPHKAADSLYILLLPFFRFQSIYN